MPIYTRSSVDDIRGWEYPPPDAPEPERVAPRYRESLTWGQISVLFVDRENKVRSVLAQFQTETARLWTLNHQGRNLFSSVDSAGFRVDTPLTQEFRRANYSPGERPNALALETVIGHPQPHTPEGLDLKARFEGQQRTRGLDYEDFDNFDYIIAFDRSDLADLRVLEKAAYRHAERISSRPRLRAKVRLLGGYNPHYDSPVDIPKPNDHSASSLNSTKWLIETELQHFLHDVLGWSKPERVASNALATPYRSRQFLVPKSNVTSRRIERLKSRCDKANVDDEIEGREFRTVTITARHGEPLRQAYDDARDIFR